MLNYQILKKLKVFGNLLKYIKNEIFSLIFINFFFGTDLGEMATISAVLYANTQHPELKHLFPNWSERCKQILKKWRSLSTEMKAPFLQHAKDNRSVLRLRRSQQVRKIINKKLFHISFLIFIKQIRA